MAELKARKKTEFDWWGGRNNKREFWSPVHTLREGERRGGGVSREHYKDTGLLKGRKGLESLGGGGRRRGLGTVALGVRNAVPTVHCIPRWTSPGDVTRV